VADEPLPPGTLHGATFRSAVPRGKLLGIDRDPAFDWGGVTVVTAADVPENVVQLIVDDQPILVPEGGEIRHRYEPLALVAAEDPLLVERALAHLSARVEPLPALFDMEESLEAKVVIAPPDNVLARNRIRQGDALAALKSCAVVVSGEYRTPHQEQLYIEPQGMVAWWDGEGPHILGSLQCPYYVHKGIKRAFHVEPDAIDVTQAPTGGGFGGKEEYPTLIALHALLLAKKSGRPVRLLYGRKEDVEATTKRHPSLVRITSGCDRDGTFRALHVEVILDGGAYTTLTPVVLSRGALHASGSYRWDDVLVEAVAVATNTPPNGAFRGFGAPQTIWAIERHVDRMARQLRMDPFVLKTKNALQLGDTTATGQVLKESVGLSECIEKAAAASGYARKRARGPVVAGRKARGIGASVFMHGAGFTGSGERRMKARLAMDLDGTAADPRFVIRTASTDIGQGTETAFRQIAASALKIAFDRIDFVQPSTRHVPDSGPTVASRTVMIVGGLVERTAKSLGLLVESERTARGGSFLDAAGRLLSRGGKISVEETYESPRGLTWDEETYRGDAYPAYGWGCDIAEVEVDLDTFETTVLGFWTAIDVGKAIHPVACRGQIEGGTLQAIGWALTEKLVMDGGTIRNPRMTDYIVPTSLDAPPFTTILVEAPFSGGPGGGAKGLGELPMDGGAPAIAAAVEHATGLVADALPLLPEELLVLSLEKKS
jgi:CO/xanthine dehydrogenase Mo-binding subunit